MRFFKLAFGFLKGNLTRILIGVVISLFLLSSGLAWQLKRSVESKGRLGEQLEQVTQINEALQEGLEWSEEARERDIQIYKDRLAERERILRREGDVHTKLKEADDTTGCFDRPDPNFDWLFDNQDS